MKKYFDYKNLIILFFISLSIFEFFNPGGYLPNRTFYITQIDSIPYAVHDTIPYEVEVEVEVEVPVEVEKLVEVEVIQKVDTEAIVKLYSENKQFKKDILELPGNIGTVTLFDTISNNRILGRSFTSKVKQKVIKDTIFTPLPRKNELYFGVDAKFDKPNVVNLIGVGFILKDKDNKHLYKLGVGVSNIVGPDGTNGTLSPFLGGGVYWRLNLKKK
jgi:hypothetical protein